MNDQNTQQSINSERNANVADDDKSTDSNETLDNKEATNGERNSATSVKSNHAPQGKREGMSISELARHVVATYK